MRDRSIENIVAREGRSCYGMGLGIIILDEVHANFQLVNMLDYAYSIVHRNFYEARSTVRAAISERER